MRLRYKGKNIYLDKVYTKTSKELVAEHNGYYINIAKEKIPNKYYAQCIHPDGGYVVDGYFDGRNFSDILGICFDNMD